MRFFEMKELMEASKYDAMFDRIRTLNFLDNPQAYTDIAQRHTDWARENLKREDRIIWFLKIAKYQLLNLILARYPDDNDIANTFPDETDNQEIAAEKKTIQRELEKLGKRINAGNIRLADWGLNLGGLKASLVHYVGQEQIPSIQNHVFGNETPTELMNTFAGYEQEWQDRVRTDTVKIQDDDQRIMSFDGGERAWWLLDRGACRAEADAMGHCGNVPSQQFGERILSFRTRVEDDYWKPHLTFILDKNGLLGEMKGRGNEKPAERYHPYIIALLKNTKIIKGIKGGGYLPEKNFSLDDLDEDTREELMQLNPNLMNVFDRYEKFGATPEILAGLEEKQAESSLPGVDSIDAKTVTLETWDDLERFARDHDIEPLEKLFRKMETEEDLLGGSLRDDDIQDMADDINVIESVYIDILSYMPTEVLKKIADDLEITADVSTYRGVFRIAQKIDKSEHGDRIRRAIVKTQDFSDQVIAKKPDLGKFIEAVFNAIYRSSRNYKASIIYDKKDILKTEVKLEMDTDDFVNVLRESFSSGDDFEDDEAFGIAMDVMHHQNWLGLDSYEMNEALKMLSGNDEYSDFSENEMKVYQRFMFMIDRTSYKMKNIKPLEVAREAMRMMQYNENHELERIKQLSGIYKKT